MSQDRAESLDDDKLGEMPPDEPLGVDEYGTTEAEERHDEPLDERVAREEPDVPTPSDDDLPLLADTGGPDRPDVTEEDRGSDPGPLSDEDIATGDTTLRDVATEHEAPPPAEEAAVREVDDDA